MFNTEMSRRILRGAGSWAALGGFAGAMNRDSTFLGGAMQGAMLGAGIGSGKFGGIGSLSAAVGGGIGAFTNGNILGYGLAAGYAGRLGSNAYARGVKGRGGISGAFGAMKTTLGRDYNRAKNIATSAYHMGNDILRSNNPFNKLQSTMKAAMR